MSRNVRERKTDAFMIAFGAISIPFGAILGALLADVGMHTRGAAPDLSGGQSAMFFLLILAICAVYLIVPIACIAWIREWRPGLWSMALVLATIALAIVMMPAGDLGIPFAMWLTVTGAWASICLALAALCRGMNLEKSFLR